VGVAEVSIGHALIGEALYTGWTPPSAPTSASSPGSAAPATDPRQKKRRPKAAFVLLAGSA
jgi:hypothetical protein